MKVLAVENNLELLKLLSHLLEKEGFETDTATGGEEALQKFAERKPDIACLDILLEDISGYEICRRMRQADPAMPILLITSKSRPADIEEGMKAGATEYIIKPFDLMSITALMHKTARSFLERKDPDGAGKFFDFGDVRVYPGQLRGERGGSEFPLNLREIGILRLLHGHKGNVVANDKLSALCWKSENMPVDKALEWQMQQLRKKIEADPANPGLIRARDGGYLFG